MAKLDDLLSDLANFDAQHDLQGLRRVREAIVSEHPDSEEAVEALYKIGLDCLFRERDLVAAVDTFDEAAKRKHPFWSAAARTSLGLCFHHQGRAQKALLELRKVAYPETPSSHSVTALGFIESILEQSGNSDDAKRARKDRVKQLEQLVDAARSGGRGNERGFYLHQLALAMREQGEGARARELLTEAKDLGPEVLGADLFRAVASALG
jgi:tetratricopeptide (TPR) repeat protein